MITKRPLRRVTRPGRLVGFELTVRNVGGIAAQDVAIVDRPRPGTGHIASARTSSGSCDDRALLACRIGTLEPGTRARVLVRVRATTARSLVNLAVVGSSTRETRLRNNLARARVRVVVVGEPRDGCASGARVGDGRAGLGARASRC